MTDLNLPISVIIPVCNESLILHQLFSCLAELSPRPSEIVFVVAGSLDDSLEEIVTWCNKSSDYNIRSLFCVQDGAYPGEARNVGVAASNEEWIAFLDVGINPVADWLGALWRCQIDTRSQAVLGVCHFSSNEFLGRIFCALSYGYRSKMPVLPASLFNKKLFQTVGLFEEKLRAGEDVLWLESLKKSGVSPVVCYEAEASYNHFPQKLLQAIRKRFVYEQSAAVAGVDFARRSIFLIGVLLVCLSALFMPLVGLGPFLFYIVIRGILDPIRRSPSRVWWYNYLQLAIMPIIACLMDLAAAFGRLSALFGFSPYSLGKKRTLT